MDTAYASSENADKPAYRHSLARAFTAHMHEVEMQMRV